MWPDRFGVDIKTTDFLATIFRRLVAICLKRDAVPIGGMATALPSRDDVVNAAAALSIAADKEWEANQGFLRGWVAHIFHMKTAADPFKQLRASGWEPPAEAHDPDNYPIRIDVPDGPVTVEGTRRNVRMVIEYIEGWLNGRGAKGIDSLAGRPGVHGPLMEDLATGRMSAAQIAQRIIHSAADTGTGTEHDFALVRRLFLDEVDDILRLLSKEVEEGNEAHQRLYEAADVRYRKAGKLGMRWVKKLHRARLQEPRIIQPRRPRGHRRRRVRLLGGAGVGLSFNRGLALTPVLDTGVRALSVGAGFKPALSSNPPCRCITRIQPPITMTL